MLILLVDAFSSSRSGRAAFQKFDRLVRSAFASVERHEQGRNQYIVRHFMRGLEVCSSTFLSHFYSAYA